MDIRGKQHLSPPGSWNLYSEKQIILSGQNCNKEIKRIQKKESLKWQWTQERNQSWFKQERVRQGKEIWKQEYPECITIAHSLFF